MITIRNDFHGTAATVRPGVPSLRTIARVRRELCGIDGCTCGGKCGENGHQDTDAQEWIMCAVDQIFAAA